jgi:hypothetical protein
MVFSKEKIPDAIINLICSYLLHIPDLRFGSEASMCQFLSKNISFTFKETLGTVQTSCPYYKEKHIKPIRWLLSEVLNYMLWGI